MIPVVSGDSLLRQTLSNRAVRTTPNNDVIDQFTHNGSTYQCITNHINISYDIHSVFRQSALGALIDGGANGGMNGCDVRVIEQTLQSADVSGLAEHAVKDLPIATVAAVLNSSRGNIIGIFHQYAHLGTGKTIHSANQMRHFGIEISDTPLAMAGKQCIRWLCYPLIHSEWTTLRGHASTNGS